MTITSITINSATLGASPGPVLNEGSSTSNSFTINGTGFPGDVTASGITFNFPGYSPAASSIDTLSSIEFAGEFYYDPGNPRRQRDAVDALRHGLDHRQLDVIPVFGELSREDQDWIGILEKELTGRSWGELGLVLEQTTSHCEPAHGRGCQ